MPGSGTPDLRSRRWFDGFDIQGYSHRGWLRHNGFSDEALRGRPVIGICNMWSELVGCNVHLRGLATAVKRGVLQAGGLPLEFPVMTPGDALQKPAAMMYRNLASMDVEETIRSNPLDAVVLLAGCDKSGPAALMGAASADVPCIMVTGGPAQPGYFRGKRVGSGNGYWKFADAARLGELSPEEYLEAEASTNRTQGHCMDMGTASTMASMSEALGMTLPGGSATPAVDVRGPCSPSGAGAVRLSWRTRACDRAAFSRGGVRERYPRARGPGRFDQRPDPPDRHRGTCGRAAHARGFPGGGGDTRAREHRADRQLPDGGLLLRRRRAGRHQRVAPAPARRRADDQRPLDRAERGREPVVESRRDPPAELAAAAPQLARRPAWFARPERRSDQAQRRIARICSGIAVRRSCSRTSTTSRRAWTTPTSTSPRTA